MTTRQATELRDRARQYRERADRDLLSPIVREAFYQMASTLESRALAIEALTTPVVGR
jgi:hypothetical protein